VCPLRERSLLPCSLITTTPQRRPAPVTTEDRALETYEALTRHEQMALVKAMENPDIPSLRREMDTGEQAELLEELPAKVVNQVLQQLSPEARQQVNLLLGFPKGSVGCIMEPSYPARPLLRPPALRSTGCATRPSTPRTWRRFWWWATGGCTKGMSPSRAS